MQRRIKQMTGVMLVASLLIACGGIDKLVQGMRAAVALSPALVNRLVASGKLSRQKADFIRADFGNVATAIQTFGNDLDAAGGDRLKQLGAAEKLSATITGIYALGHYGADPQVLEAANLINDLVAGVVAYFGGGPPSAKAAVKPTKAQIEAKIKELEAAMKR